MTTSRPAIACLGAGRMGRGIAVAFAYAGHTVSMIDVYQRHFHRQGTDRHFLLASRAATVFWGLYAVAFANFAQGFGALIEAVNQVGSLFYGSMLGVFVVAFFMKRAAGTAAGRTPTAALRRTGRA